MKIAKLDRFLNSALEMRNRIDPSTPMDIVIEPAADATVEEVARLLSAHTLKPSRVASNRVNCRVPAGEIAELAGNRLIGAIRAARTHTAQAF